MTARSSARRSPGKRVGDALYLHISAIGMQDTRKTKAIDAAVRLAGIGRQAFNVVKLSRRDPQRITLLAYQSFDSSPFPALVDSWTVNAKDGTCSHRSYRTSRNPPILHRKELLLRLEDPRRTAFAQLTETLESHGLFVDPKSIGFKRQWEMRLRKAGITIVNHEVIDASGSDTDPREPAVPIVRFRTAISRNGLSAPMQALDRHGFLNGTHTVFDYGCGRGDDIAALLAAGVAASGWDPHFAPEAPLEESDIVNLGFVLNVIEDPKERSEVLQAAFALARRVLTVAVMAAGREGTAALQPHSDGFLSSRGTFQKYFSQQEVRALVRAAIDQEAIPLAPGVFFIFRDKVLEQRFLERRRRRNRDAPSLRLVRSPTKHQTLQRADALLEANRELIEALWERAVELGRPPHLDELEAEIGQEILVRLGSLTKAVHLAFAASESKAVERAAQARTDDLTLYFAMNLFGNRKRYRELPAELQRDVRAFFGSYANAEATARTLLFSLADPAVLQEASTQAHTEGIGHFDGMHSIKLDVRLLDRLPTKLRAYVGCAEQLYGDIGEADLVKIHIASRKLSLLKYWDYDDSPLPLLRERVKIDLGRQEIRFFAYGTGERGSLLYLKSQYMADNLTGYKRQRAFDTRLVSLGLLPSEGREPTRSEFARLLWERELAVQGFDLVKKRARHLS